MKMNQRIISTILFCLFISAVHSQSKMQPPVFVMTVQGGIMEGQTDKTVPQFQLLGGIKKNAWVLSLGMGMDYYSSKRSVPVFVDFKNMFGKNRNSFFLYGAAGYNFSWLRNSQKINNWWGNVLSHNQKGGLFYEAGMGYKVSLKNKMGFGLSAGYSYKEQSETIKYLPFCDRCLPPQPAIEPQPEIYKYKFQRVSIKLHYWF
jgi:opacity protein-like surface antigen